jgi:hypothetical protein
LVEFERGEKVKSHRDRRLALNSLELKDPQIRAMGFRDRFGAREHYLHEMCFYEGEYLPEGVRDDISKVELHRRCGEGIKRMTRLPWLQK